MPCRFLPFSLNISYPASLISDQLVCYFYMKALSAFFYNADLASFCNVAFLLCRLLSLNICPSQDLFPRLTLLLRRAPAQGGFRDLEIKNILLAVASNGGTPLKMAQMAQISGLFNGSLFLVCRARMDFSHLLVEH